MVGLTKEPPDPGEDSQTAALLDDLLRMRGSFCKECGTSLCGHETLMSLAAGCKDSPRCLPCLSRLMGRSREEVRDHLLAYIRNRSCRNVGWMWANREEGTEPSALPKCLWPDDGLAYNLDKTVHIVNDSLNNPIPNLVPDAEWDAGDRGCGEFVMDLRVKLLQMGPRQILKLTARDAGVPEDLPAWCRMTGHKLLIANHPEYWIERREN